MKTLTENIFELPFTLSLPPAELRRAIALLSPRRHFRQFLIAAAASRAAAAGLQIRR